MFSSCGSNSYLTEGVVAIPLKCLLPLVLFCFLILNVFIHVYLFILRNFCHRPRENQIFLSILRVRNRFLYFRVFLPFGRIWHHYDVVWKLLVLILVDMDRGGQDLYIRIKTALYVSKQHYRALITEKPWGIQQPLLVRYVTKNKQTNNKQQKTAWLDKGYNIGGIARGQSEVHPSHPPSHEMKLCTGVKGETSVWFPPLCTHHSECLATPLVNIGSILSQIVVREHTLFLLLWT